MSMEVERTGQVQVAFRKIHSQDWVLGLRRERENECQAFYLGDDTHDSAIIQAMTLRRKKRFETQADELKVGTLTVKCLWIIRWKCPVRP